MTISFASSPRPTIGVEIELQLINRDTMDLAPRSIELLKMCEQRGFSRIKAEMTQSMVEIDTEISADVKECRGFLETRFRQLRSVTEELGIALCVAGTHPFQRWASRKLYPHPRFEYILEKYRWLARRLTVYGLHVHVGIESGEQAIAVSNHAIAYLPHLLALSTSSPYWEETDTGMQSCRAGILDSFPISGLPYYFPDWRGFETYCETLSRVGAIASLKDLYWFVRPSPVYGTLEFRICDGMPMLCDTLAVVALIQALVVHITEGLQDGSREREVSMRHYWISPENLWTAARDGLDGMLILDERGERRKIGEDVLLLVDKLLPVARRLNSEAELLHVKEIVRRGTSASRQRAVMRATGHLPTVVQALIEELETDRPVIL